MVGNTATNEGIAEESAMDLMTVEYYASNDPDRLIGAAYVPRKDAARCVRVIGRALCQALMMDSVEGRLLDRNGELTERMIVKR